MLAEYGVERMIVSGSADWGVSDPLSLVKVSEYMKTQGMDDSGISRILFDNPNAFYSQSPRWKPDFSIVPMDPREFQR